MDAVFSALADPTRRELLDALYREDGQTLGALVKGFSMTRFGACHREPLHERPKRLPVLAIERVEQLPASRVGQCAEHRVHTVDNR